MAAVYPRLAHRRPRPPPTLRSTRETCLASGTLWPAQVWWRPQGKHDRLIVSEYACLCTCLFECVCVRNRHQYDRVVETAVTCVPSARFGSQLRHRGPSQTAAPDVEVIDPAAECNHLHLRDGTRCGGGRRGGRRERCRELVYGRKPKGEPDDSRGRSRPRRVCNPPGAGEESEPLRGLLVAVATPGALSLGPGVFRRRP